jgi:hypothetical protein
MNLISFEVPAFVLRQLIDAGLAGLPRAVHRLGGTMVFKRMFFISGLVCAALCGGAVANRASIQAHWHILGAPEREAG